MNNTCTTTSFRYNERFVSITLASSELFNTKHVNLSIEILTMSHIFTYTILLQYYSFAYCYPIILHKFVKVDFPIGAIYVTDAALIISKSPHPLRDIFVLWSFVFCSMTVITTIAMQKYIPVIIVYEGCHT